MRQVTNYEYIKHFQNIFIYFITFIGKFFQALFVILKKVPSRVVLDILDLGFSNFYFKVTTFLLNLLVSTFPFLFTLRALEIPM